MMNDLHGILARMREGVCIVTTVPRDSARTLTKTSLNALSPPRLDMLINLLGPTGSPLQSDQRALQVVYASA